MSQCKTVYEKKCHTTNETKYKTEYEKKCNTTCQKKCHTTNNTIYKLKCSTSYVPKVGTVTRFFQVVSFLTLLSLLAVQQALRDRV